MIVHNAKVFSTKKSLMKNNQKGDNSYQDPLDQVTNLNQENSNEKIKLINTQTDNTNSNSSGSASASASASDISSSKEALLGSLQTAKDSVLGYKYISSCLKGFINALPSSFCVKKNADVGIVPTECVDGWVRQGAMCYKKCEPDMTLVAGVCWKNCKKGFTDLGLICFKKPFKIYFKRSYVTKQATNFDTQSKCKSGYYKNGALCYRDCRNIEMVNCGIGYCALNESECKTGLTVMSLDIVYGILKLLLFVASFGTSSVATGAAGAAAAPKPDVTPAAKSVTLMGSAFNYINNSMKSFWKKIIEKYGKAKLQMSLTIKKMKEMSAKEFLESYEKGAIEWFKGYSQKRLGPIITNTVCMEVAKGFIEGHLSSTLDSNSVDWSLFDLTGISQSVDKCDNIQTESDKMMCAKSVMNIMKPLDPTGVITLASAFMNPICEVPGYIPELEPKDGCVRFYEYIDFKGFYNDICTSIKSDFKFGQRSNSLKVSPTVNVLIYKGSNFSGDEAFIQAGDFVSDLSYVPMNENIASFKLMHIGARENCIVFFDNCDYTGNSYQFCDSKTSLPSTTETLLIDYKSIIVGEGQGLIIYNQENYKGSSLVMISNSNNACLATNGFASVVKSFHLFTVAKEGCVKFWKECNFKTDISETCISSLDATKSNYISANSLFVGANSLLIMYPSINYKGDYIMFYSSSITCLTNEFSATNIKGETVKLNLSTHLKSFTITKIMPSDGCVVVFENEEFTGRAREICKTENKFFFNIDELINNKQISFTSIRIGNGILTLELFSGENLSGDSINITNSESNGIANLSQFNFDKKARSLKIIPSIKENCTIYYENPNFQGQKTEICGINKNTKITFGSLVVSEGVQLSLYGSKDLIDFKVFYNGYFEILDTTNGGKSSMPSYISYELNQIEPASCLNFFTEKNFGGRIKNICDDSSDLSSLISKNYLSMKIGKNLREVYFFTEKSYGGGEYYAIDSSSKIDNDVRELEAKSYTKKYSTLEAGTEIIDLNSWYYGQSNIAFKDLKSMLIIPLAPEPGCVAFYHDSYFKGTKAVICESDKISDLKKQYSSFYKKISSLIIGDNTQLRMGTESKKSQRYLFGEKNVFKMPRFIYKDSRNTTTTTNLDNVTAYISVLNLNEAENQCLILFEKKYYLGDAIKYCKQKSDGFPLIGTSKSFKVGTNIRRLTVGTSTLEVVLEKNDIRNIPDVSLLKNKFDNISKFEIIPQINEDCAMIYSTHKGRAELCKSSATYNKDILVGGMFKDATSSVITGKNISAFIYSNDKYQSLMKKLNPWEKYDNTKKDDEIFFKSIIIVPITEGCVRIFTQTNFTDVNNLYCKSSPKVTGYTTTLSVIAGSDIKQAVLYSEENYTGNSLTLYENGYINNTKTLNFLIKSILIVPKANQNCIKINNLCYFEGETYEICEDIENFNDINKDVDPANIQSIIVGSDIQGRFFKNENFAKGDYVTFSKEVEKEFSTCLKTQEKVTFNFNSISLLENSPKLNCYMLYEKCDFLGERNEYCYGFSDTAVLLSNNFLSIKTGSSAEVSLFDDLNYKKITFSQVIQKNDSSNTCLSGSATKPKSINYNFYSDDIKQTDVSCVVVYNKCDFTGSMLEICANIASLSNNQYLSSFDVLSLKVGSNAQISLFSEEDYKGNKFSFGKDFATKYSRCLTNEFKDKVKSISISYINSTLVANGFVSPIKITKDFYSVKEECYILFSECGFSGNYIQVCTGLSSLFEKIESVGSVIVGKNINLKLYNEEAFTGEKTITLEENKEYDCFDKYNFNKLTKSISLDIVDPNVIFD